MSSKNIALVLSGGGARGIAHIGVIEALEARDYNIVSVAGTSMGSVIGGAYALGKLDAFKKWLLELDRRQVFKLVDFTFSRQGLIKGDRVFETMRELLGEADFADLHIPFAAVAADVVNKKEVVFTNGSLYNALRASVAIPTVFTPVHTKDGLLVDGGILNNLPIRYVDCSQADLMVAVNVNADIPVAHQETAPPPEETEKSTFETIIDQFASWLPSSSTEHNLNYFDLINATINLMTNRIAQLAIAQHEPEVLIKVSSDLCGMFDFHKAQYAIDAGRKAAEAVLDEFEHRS